VDLSEKQKAKEDKIDDDDDYDDEYGQGDSVIPHIKQTLILFLKNIPLSDPKNEDILNVIFNLMRFNPAEIQQLKLDRINAQNKVSSKGKIGSARKQNST